MTTQKQTAALLAMGTGAALGFAASRAWGRHSIDLKGRVVLITGASRGLGLELARAFAEEGASLALLARDEAELLRAQQDLADRGGRVLTIPTDVRDRHEVDAAVQRAVAHFGRLDVLIHNAGVITVGPFEHMTLEDFEHAMGVHYWAALHAIRAALPHLRRSPGARIINVTSIGGRVGVPHLTPYCGSKFALAGLSDALRAELAPEGIRVTTVVPWLMRTGSPINATFKGRHRAEFTWFSISDSLPLVSVNARRAALQIVDACRRGTPSLIIGTPAYLAQLLDAAAPSLFAGAMALAARFLPRPDPQTGSEARLGWQSQSRWAPSFVTTLGDRAARRNNESEPALPIAAGRRDA